MAQLKWRMDNRLTRQWMKLRHRSEHPRMYRDSLIMNELLKRKRKATQRTIK